MKKKILCLLMVLILPVLCLCGCSKSTTSNTNAQGDSLVCVEQNANLSGCYYIFVNRNTRVMYFYFRSGNGGGLIVMLNADGTPMLWEGEL